MKHKERVSKIEENHNTIVQVNGRYYFGVIVPFEEIKGEVFHTDVAYLIDRVRVLTEALIDIEIAPRILHEVNLIENIQNIARKALVEGE